MKYALLFSIAIALNAYPASAIGKREVPINRLESGQRFEVAQGYGLTINLMPVGKVNRAWLTDKSWLTIANENGACQNGGCGQSRFLYLQRIDKLKFAGQPGTVDGATLLNVVTTTGEILQFHLTRDQDGIPAYTALYVVPPQQAQFKPVAQPMSQAIPEPQSSSQVLPEPQPLVRQIPIEIEISKHLPKPAQENNSVSKQVSGQSLELVAQEEDTSRQVSKESLKPQKEKNLKPNRAVVEKSPAPTTLPERSAEVEKMTSSKITSPIPQPENPSHQDYATALRKGLVTARLNKQIGYQSRVYRRVQSTIRLLSRGTPLEKARVRSGVEQKTIDQLLKWGFSK